MKNRYSIYAYKFKLDDILYAYVGLTNNPFMRNESHHHKGTVHDFCINNNLSIPKMEILEDNLDRFSAQAKEGDWIEYLSDNGYKILNKAKCGLFVSSLGTLNDNIKICKESVKEKEARCFNAAKQYNKKEDFKRSSPEEYRLSCSHGWLSSYYWLSDEKASKNKEQRNKKPLYTKEEYKKYITEYNIISRTGLSVSNPKLYKVARLSGWLDEDFVRYKSKQNITSEQIFLDKNIENNLVQCKRNTSLYIDNKTLKIYKKSKQKLKKVEPHPNHQGFMVVYNILFHDILIDLMGNQYNVVTYLDGNLSNINLDNLKFEHIDINEYRPIQELPNAYINKEGKIYNSKYKTYVDTFINNDVEYTVQKHLVTQKLVQKYWRYDNETTFVEKPKEDVKKIKETNIILDRTQIKNRVYGNGVYWHKSSNKWHSKILYDYHEYSLGYYDSFNTGKYVYEQASLAIKYNIFNEWYKNIDKYRSILRSSFTDNTLLFNIEKEVKEVKDKNDTEKLIAEYENKIEQILKSTKNKTIEYKKKYYELIKKYNSLNYEKTELLKSIHKTQELNKRIYHRNYFINEYGSYVFQIPYIDGKTYYITSIKSKEVAKELDELLTKHKLYDKNFIEWLQTFKENELKTYIARDVLYLNEHCRTAKGYMWFKPRNCWKVKKLYNGKEYLIGYFKEEKCCQFILNEIKTVIDIGDFEKWFEDIKEHRYRVKKLFNDPMLETPVNTVLKVAQSPVEETRLPHIRQYKNGVIVGEFYTLKEANKQFNNENKNGHKAIMDCCNGKQKTYKGFQWEYINSRK